MSLWHMYTPEGVAVEEEVEAEAEVHRTVHYP
jgi:hypothetical protein